MIELFRSLLFDGEFSVKIATWANNDSVRLHPKAKLINSMRKLNLIPKVHFFSRKLVRNIHLTRDKLRDVRIDIIRDSPSCNKDEEILTIPL